jgi:hypothetical protein
LGRGGNWPPPSPSIFVNRCSERGCIAHLPSFLAYSTIRCPARAPVTRPARIRACSGASEFSAGTWLKTIVGVDVTDWERQALSAKQTAKTDSASPIATILEPTFYRYLSHGKTDQPRPLRNGAPLNSAQQSHAVGTNPDNRYECVRLISVDPQFARRLYTQGDLYEPGTCGASRTNKRLIHVRYPPQQWWGQ